MTVRDLILDCVEVQDGCHYCYYDYEKSCRIEITEKEAKSCDIRCIYCEDGELYIEVEKWEED